MNIDQNHTKARGLIPDYMVAGVADIDFAGLYGIGIRCLVLDVDHTLVRYNTALLDDTLRDFLLAQKRAGYIEQICIASNSNRDLSSIASSIGAQTLRAGRFIKKPSRLYFGRLLKELKREPHEVVMVGDKLLTDIWGGNRAGLLTILVNPIGPDRLFDRLLMTRWWGRRYVRRFRK